MYKDLTGVEFGRLTVIKRAEDYVSPKGVRQRKWTCICNCKDKTIKDINENNLLRGKVLSCGCLARETTSKLSLKDLTGKKFGRLTVTNRAEDYIRNDGKRDVMWNCNCECGSHTVVLGESLRTGHTESCGCLAIELNILRSTTPKEGESFEENDIYNRAQYWDYTKNKVLPTQVKKSSNRKFWFNCPIHGSFKISLNDVNNGSWCAICSKGRIDSQLAIIVSTISKKLYPKDVVLEYRGGFIKNTKESPLDLLIGNKKYAIEFQSQYHDESKSKIINGKMIFNYRKVDFEKKEYYEKLGYKYFMFDCREWNYKEIEVLKILFPEINECQLEIMIKDVDLNQYQRIQWDINEAQNLLDNTDYSYFKIGELLNTTEKSINSAIQRNILVLKNNRKNKYDWYLQEAQELLDKTSMTYNEIANKLNIKPYNISDAVYHNRLILPQSRKKKEIDVVKIQYLLDTTDLTYSQIALESNTTVDKIKYAIKKGKLKK